MLEALEFFGSVAGSITTIALCLATLVKPIRTLLVMKLQEMVQTSTQDKLILEIRDTLKQHMEQDNANFENGKLQNETMLGIIRDSITRMYYNYLNSNGIPSYERENLVKQYTLYHKMNGNTYIDIIYNEMLEWDVLK